MRDGAVVIFGVAACGSGIAVAAGPAVRGRRYDDSVSAPASVPTPYEDLLREVLDDGVHKDDRTGTGTTSVFGRQIRFDLSQGFPLITTKRVHLKSIVYELLLSLIHISEPTRPY